MRFASLLERVSKLVQEVRERLCIRFEHATMLENSKVRVDHFAKHEMGFPKFDESHLRQNKNTIKE